MHRNHSFTERTDPIKTPVISVHLLRKAHLKTREELVTDPSPTTAQFLTNLKTCEIIISKHDLLIMFKTSDWTYQFCHIGEAAGLLTPVHASRPHCSTPHHTQGCPMALRLYPTARFLPSANLKHAAVLVQNHMLPLELLPMSWHLLWLWKETEGHSRATPWLWRYRIIHARFQRASYHKAKKQEKRAQSSALPLETHHGCSVKKPQLRSQRRDPGEGSSANLLSHTGWKTTAWIYEKWKLWHLAFCWNRCF